MTAIDAVTGDAANMAAESDINDVVTENVLNTGNVGSTTRPVARHPTKPATPDEPTTSPVGNAAGNSTD